MLHLLLLAVAAAQAVQEKVIIVADVGVDDAAGLLWAASRPDVFDVLFVGASFGSHPDPRVTAANARKVLASAGRDDVPVLVGARWPLGATAPHATDDVTKRFMGSDGFGGAGAAAECDAPSSDVSVAEAIVAAARRYPGEVTVLHFSPLTNLALASLLEPELASLLKGVVAMGGALDVPGNVSPLAEANFAHDALAAQIVCEVFGTKLVLAPLDVTETALVTRVDLAAGTVAARLLAEAFETFQTAYCEVLGLCEGAPLHDAHVVAFAADQSLYETREVGVEVLVSDVSTTRGAVVVDGRPFASPTTTVTALSRVDAPRFVAALGERLAAL